MRISHTKALKFGEAYPGRGEELAQKAKSQHSLYIRSEVRIMRSREAHNNPLEILSLNLRLDRERYCSITTQLRILASRGI